jgi:ATP-dependent exoDNAse (exonuclease V) beta subunit
MHPALAAMLTPSAAAATTKTTQKRTKSKASDPTEPTDPTDPVQTDPKVPQHVPDYLAKKNPHPRDAFITFDEGPHIYTVHGKQGFTSVTTFVHHQFPTFDAEAIVAKILASPKWDTDPTYKYYQMSRETILADWDTNRDQAARAGTLMHYDIECYFNQEFVTNTSTEFQYFQKFVADYPVLVPYRTEWMVYYEEYKLSGSIDMIFENPDGTLQIYDWKRCKSIDFEAFGGATALTPCIAHMPDTNFWHYSIQLNMYRRILEDKYDKKVTGLYLVCLHPDNPYKTYSRIQVPFLDAEIQALLDAWCAKQPKQPKCTKQTK